MAHEAQSSKKTSKSKSSFSNGTSSLENRRMRNRLSQKACRQKQAIYVKELETRLGNSTRQESELVRDLREENFSLRQQLLECHRKLEGACGTLKSLSASVEGLLDLEKKSKPPGDDSDTNQGQIPVEPTLSATPEIVNSSLPEFNRIFDGQDGLSMSGSLQLELEAISSPPASHEMDANSTKETCVIVEQGFDLVRDQTSLITTAESMLSEKHVPRSLSTLSHMGPSVYGSIVSRPCQDRSNGLEITHTNSGFSDHIEAIENCLRKCIANSGLLQQCGSNSLAQAIRFMMWSFVCVAWPEMIPWHAYTKAHAAISMVSMWRLVPNSVNRLAVGYQPTPTQLALLYPAVIDWIPFPSLRDKLILYHSANPMLDTIICDLGESYVVEGDLSKIVENFSSMLGCVGVFDLVRAISDAGRENRLSPPPLTAAYGLFSEGHASMDHLAGYGGLEELGPDGGNLDTGVLAPNVEALFKSRQYAYSAYKALGLGKGSAEFRLAPKFFEKHPELYDPNADIIGRGLYLRPTEQKSMQSPGRPDPSSLANYRALAKWSLEIPEEPVAQKMNTLT
ncbi:uncharacterized protein A1O5_06335 [Cladophialophora psammophila CBS 110553]|uniref:BZIP domain-containing protein n=1 Tax=Cladophialophora psammophila CBS 110553 TaxID=1182543 RepID=W9WQ11_9EURO|nr:uncharacterized protein A1O5_06335 [Cladophialophora psammophila CBS 110553]EXJ70267.1 hypothetical protein A1O5_06335 [Cladophialophora psammophila CBS 110553]